MSPVLQAWRLNHWTAREVLSHLLFRKTTMTATWVGWERVNNGREPKLEGFCFFFSVNQVKITRSQNRQI